MRTLLMAAAVPTLLAPSACGWQPGRVEAWVLQAAPSAVAPSPAAWLQALHAWQAECLCEPGILEGEANLVFSGRKGLFIACCYSW